MLNNKLWSNKKNLRNFFVIFISLTLLIGLGYLAIEILSKEKEPKNQRVESYEKDSYDDVRSSNNEKNKENSEYSANDEKLQNNQPPQLGEYNFGEALQKAIFFYECQRSGKLDRSKLRLNWRGDSGLSDGADVGVDLTGGWYDAGDHVKFGLPMAYSSAILGWSVYENKEAYERSGQLTHILNNIKWSTDYFIKCHTKKDEFYYQVGDGHADHGWWGPAEAMNMKRPSYKVDIKKPGSTVTAQTAAALAIASLIFGDEDKDYSKKCLKHAEELFDFADKTKSDEGYTEAKDFYNSWSGFYDELSWAGVWLYLATNNKVYLDKAEEYVANWKREGQTDKIAYKWALCWDDVHNGAELLLARITNKLIYKEALENHLDYWAGVGTESIKYTPKGLAWLDQWGALRYATTEAFLASCYADWKGCSKEKASAYNEFAKKQVEYALGSSGRSFVVGYGNNPPEHCHHRTAQGSWADNMNIPDKHRHILYGALVGGPGNDDSYKDEVSNYINNEVACDYNAGFVGALAKMYLLYGGRPIEGFNAIEKPGEEYFVEACVNASGNDFVEIKAILNNVSGWPARSSDKLSFKYFINLSEVRKQAKSTNVKLSINYNQGGAKISQIKPLKDNIYYVLVDFSGTIIRPGGQSEYKKEVQFRISVDGGQNLENDYSYMGLSTGTVTKTQYIPVYDAGKKVWGQEPGEFLGTKEDTTTDKDSAKADTELQPQATESSTSQKSSEAAPIKVEKDKVSGGISLQTFNSDTSARTNTISPKFRLINNGSKSIKLSDVKIKYFYTIDGEEKQNFFCDWSTVGKENVIGKFIKLKKVKNSADYILEIGFDPRSGNLESGKPIELQTRVSKEDWSQYDQLNDYSFNSSAKTYSDWNKTVLYVSQKCLVGIEP